MFTTAHEEWDRTWRDADARAAWSHPEAPVVALADDRRGSRTITVLDVGCGVGRHALTFARAGLRVSALDASATGLRVLRDAAYDEGLDIALHRGHFDALPFAEDVFDVVLAWNVLYHGDGDVVQHALRECARVLRSNGVLQFTMLSKANARYGAGTEVAPDTFVIESNGVIEADDDSDKMHPHFYVDAERLRVMLADAGLVLRSVDDVDQKPPTRAYHLVARAERP